MHRHFDSLTSNQPARHRHYGDTNLGLLHLVIPETDCIKKSSTLQPYPVQNNPGLTPSKPTKTTGTEDKPTDPPTLTNTTIPKAKPSTSELAEALRIHELEIQNYNLITNATTQLKNLIINAVPVSYLYWHTQRSYHNVLFSFTSRTAYAPLGGIWHYHLWWFIRQLHQNNCSLVSTYSYRKLIWTTEKGQEFGAKGGETFDEPQLMRLVLTNILATGLFNDAGKTWSTEKAKNANCAVFKKWVQIKSNILPITQLKQDSLPRPQDSLPLQSQRLKKRAHISESL